MGEAGRAVIEREMAERGFFITVGKGFSMKPLLKPGKNLLKIYPPENDYKKYDVILFQNAVGDCVLHRIIKAGADVYTTRGDGSILKEAGIGKDDILGILKEFVRDTDKDNTKWVNVSDWRYVCYSRLIVLASPAVRAIRRLQSL